MRAIIRGGVVLAVLCVAGCGSGQRIHVQGRLVKGGSPFTPPEGASNQVVFVAVDVKGDSEPNIARDEPFAAAVNQEDGTFEVLGPDGTGIPPGKYRVAVTQKYRTKHDIDVPKKRGEAPVNRDTDLLGERFSPTQSPIIVEVLQSDQIVVDLDQPASAPRL
jgi:hypothetical protein